MAPVSGSTGADGGSIRAIRLGADHVVPWFFERCTITSQGILGALGGRNGDALARRYRLTRVPSGRTSMKVGSGSAPARSVVIRRGADHVRPRSAVRLKYSIPSAPTIPSRRTHT